MQVDYSQLQRQCAESASKFADVCERFRPQLLSRKMYARSQEKPLLQLLQLLCSSPFIRKNATLLLELLGITVGYFALLSPHARSSITNLIQSIINESNNHARNNSLLPTHNLHWRSSAQMSGLKRILVSPGMPDPPSAPESIYPYDASKFARLIGHLVPVCRLPENFYQHDVNFIVPDEYLALLKVSAASPGLTPIYVARLVCRSNETHRLVWPACIVSAYIGGKEVTLPRQWVALVKSNNDTKERQFRGNNHPADVTPFLERGVNTLSIMASGHTDITRINFAVEFIALVSKSAARNDVKHHQIMHTTRSLQQLNIFIKSKTFIEIPLRCPIKQINLKICVRSRACQHVSCFELDSWLDLPTTDPICPICNIPITIDKLIVDPFMSTMARIIPAEGSQIILFPDGTFCVPELLPEKHMNVQEELSQLQYYTIFRIKPMVSASTVAPQKRVLAVEESDPGQGVKKMKE
ncbi:hypothetical protein BJ741DRAFT_631365 [Chytriomyces cf. hyalinus JEL632]|nr:hypothetical protein BJ741DRAFT_631365 [Chytriomyces cf. hyalinus JEL632]